VNRFYLPLYKSIKHIHGLIALACYPLFLLVTGCGSSESTEESDDQRITPSIAVLDQVVASSIRGLDMVNDSVTWASGSNGVFMRCINGQDWEWDSIPGYTHLDFRDIEGFDEQTALVMAAGNEGLILRTEDGGESWEEVFRDEREGVFLDGMDFDGLQGYCIGDPIGEEMYIIETLDGGSSWSIPEYPELPASILGEGSYAASGTTIIFENDIVLAAYGGDSLTRVLMKNPERWTSVEAPMAQGAGCGIFSLAMDQETVIAVGGCYLDSTSALGNIAISPDGGSTWSIPEGAPRGYRSCVAFSADGSFTLACGRTGVDISYDRGRTWQALSDEGFFTMVLGEQVGWLMGRNGKLARVHW